MADVSRLLRAKPYFIFILINAMIDGRKYITNPNPKKGKKNAGKRCVIRTPSTIA